MAGNVFVALPLCDEERGYVAAIRDQLAEIAPRTRFVRPANWHFTLVFLGKTERIDDAIKAIRCVEAPSFDMLVGGLGFFGRGREKTLWLGTERSRPLFRLQEQLAQAYHDADFVLPDRKFIPHLTLSRRWSNKIPYSIEELSAAIRPFSMRVDSISLMRTEQEGDHVIYEELYRHELELI